MSGRTVLLLVAGIIAAFAAISVRNRLSQSPPPEVVQSVRVVIAKHDLSPGTFVQGAQDLDWGTPPTPPPATADKTKSPDEVKSDENATPENYLHEGSVKLTDFNGAVVRRQLRAGDPVPSTALMKSGEGGFMSAVLNPGMRAVSIAVNATSGNAGFISPGDHVDLIVTHRVKTQEGAGNEAVLSETFVRDVRVVAVDQMLDNPENKAILAKTVTVEVQPHQAEQVSVAAEMGKISIALRSISPDMPKRPAPGSVGDLYNDAPQDGNYTSSSDLSQLRSAMVPHVQIIRGDKVESMEFYRDSGQ